MEDNMNYVSNGMTENTMLNNKQAMYKGKNYMSLSAFQTLTKEVAIHQKSLQISKSRSAGDLKSDKSNSQKALYGSLPFFATFGMQHKENSVYDLLSNIRLLSFESLPNTDSDVKHKHDRDHEIDEVVITLPLIIGVITAMTLQFLIGYNMGVCNGAYHQMFSPHSLWSWSAVIGSLTLGAPIGAFTGGYLCNIYGRKTSILLCCLFYLVGSFLCMTSVNIYLLMAGRVVCGVGVGVAAIIVPIYLGEISPPTLRGTLGTMTLAAQYLGLFISGIAVYPLQALGPTSSSTSTSSSTEMILPYETSEQWKWRILFVISFVLCIIQLFVFPFLLESPRWLLGNNENSKLARSTIRRFRGYRSEDEVEREVKNFLYGSIRHKTKRKSAHSLEAMKDLMWDRDYKHLILGIICLQCARQWCGVNVLFYYSTLLYTDAKLSSPLTFTCIVLFVNFCSVYIALQLIRFIERRHLLLVSTGGMFLSIMMITASLHSILPSICFFYASISLVFCFIIGLGPIPALLIAEMIEAKYVATAMTIMTIVTWTSNIITAFLFLPSRIILGGYCFLPFACILAITFIIVLLYLPDTLGKTVEEVQKRLAMNPDDLMNVIVESVEIDYMDSFFADDPDIIPVSSSCSAGSVQSAQPTEKFKANNLLSSTGPVVRKEELSTQSAKL